MKMAGSPPQLIQANTVATALLDWIGQTLCLIGSLVWLVICTSYHLLLWRNSHMNFDPWKVNSDQLLDRDENDLGGHEIKGYNTGTWKCTAGGQTEDGESKVRLRRKNILTFLYLQSYHLLLYHFPQFFYAARMNHQLLGQLLRIIINYKSLYYERCYSVTRQNFML